MTLFVAIGALVSGFLLHAITGHPGQGSPGTLLAVAGGTLMVFALIILVYGLVRVPQTVTEDQV